MGYFGLLIITLVFLAYLIRGGWRTLRPTYLDLPIAVFLLIRIISTVTSVDPVTSWKGLEKSGLLLAYYPLAHMNLGRERRLAGVWIHVAAIIIAAAAGGFEVALGMERRVVSRTGGYTTFAEILAVAACLGAAFMAFSRGKRWLAQGAAAFVALGALVLTFCRGQWLGLAAGLGLIGGLKDRKAFAALALVAAAALIAVWLSPVGLASGRFTLGDPAFENYRDVLWRGGLEQAFARPLTGFGPNTIKIVFPDQTRFYSPVAKVIGWHNDFLQLAVESGLGAVVAMLWIGTAAFGGTLAAFRRREADYRFRALGLGLAAAVLTLVVGALVGNVVTDPAMLIQFVFLFGLFAPYAGGGGNDDAV